jgi:hypothetical protein
MIRTVTEDLEADWTRPPGAWRLGRHIAPGRSSCLSRLNIEVWRHSRTMAGSPTEITVVLLK